MHITEHFLKNEPYRENAITDTENLPIWQLNHFLSDVNNKHVREMVAKS